MANAKPSISDRRVTCTSKTQKTKAKVPTVKYVVSENRVPPGCGCIRKNAEEDTVEIARVVETGLAPGVMLFGEKEHEAIAGRLAHEKVTALLNDPLEGVTVTV
jgi:hypothetical protein